jgi:hypothetical protein
VFTTAFPTLEDQIVRCTDRWAVRHCIVHEATGLVVPMVCDKYSCKYCGPRRVEMWRSLIEMAEPERFITLTRVGRTLFEVGRVATTVVQRLRRKGYTFEYCLTFERHKNGYFHIHMLQKGDYIPQKVLSDCLRTATHGFSYVVDIRRCTPGTAGYVTKYCTKVLATNEIGSRSDGTRARVNRVRYSKGFFPSPTKVLKQAFRVAAAEKKGEVSAADNFVTCDRCQGTGEYKDVKCIKCKGEGVCSAWKLLEMAPLPRDDDGWVIEEAAYEQYQRLVTMRVQEANTETVKLSNGGKQVLAYMMLESLRLGEVAK